MYTFIISLAVIRSAIDISSDNLLCRLQRLALIVNSSVIVVARNQIKVQGVKLYFVDTITVLAEYSNINNVWPEIVTHFTKRLTDCKCLPFFLIIL